MKLPLAIIAVAGAIAFSGCPKQELSLDKDGKRLAPVVGANPTEIRFINRTLYAITPVGENKTKTKYAGFVALTATDVVFGEGSPRSLRQEDVLRVPIRDIEGMTQAGPMFQIVYDGNMITGLPYRWFSDTVDRESLMEFMDQLLRDDIPVIAYTRIEGFSNRVFSSFGSYSGIGNYAVNEDFPDLYDDGGVPRDELYDRPEYPEPLYPVQFNSDLNGTPPPYPQGQYPTTGQ